MVPNTPKRGGFASSSSSSLSGISIHTAIARKDAPRIQRSICGPDQGGEPGAERAGQRVVGQGGDKDAGDDGPGLAETRSEDEGEQLRLVAHFGEGDDAGGDEESFHERELRPKTIDCTASPA